MKALPSLVLLLLALTAVPGKLAAVEQRQGALRLQEAEGELFLRLPGEEERRLAEGETPLFFGALGGIRLEKDATALLLASNGLTLFYRGPARVAVERFVQESWEGEPPGYAEMAVEPSASRLVLSQAEGELAVDGSLQADGSRLVLETPVGAVAAGRAVWSFSLTVDRRSRINNFVIKVRGGEIRFVDRRGHRYSLYAGQRLSGVGSSLSPAIEIGELKEERESAVFAELAARKAAALANGVPWAGFLDRMTSVVAGDGEETAPSADEGMPGDDAGVRPITIDFVSRVPDSIPFRATVVPPPAPGPER
jgi:hypothetical protein